MAAYQAPLSLGFSRQEHWSGFPFPSPMHESEKSKWSRSVVSDSSWPHGLQPTRLLCPWDFPGKSTGVGCHCLLRMYSAYKLNKQGDKAALTYSFSYLEPVCCSMSSSNCCFLTCIQISQEAGQMVWYPHLFQNFPEFVVVHTVKGFGVVDKAEVDVFLKLSCFFHDPADVGNLISGSSLSFLNPAWTSGSSWFTYCWSLAWRILNILY